MAVGIAFAVAVAVGSDVDVVLVHLLRMQFSLSFFTYLFIRFEGQAPCVDVSGCRSEYRTATTTKTLYLRIDHVVAYASTQWAKIPYR